ncbi:MAG: hypothetical protein ABIO44_00305 [Saprospiraceae bacterium]
MAQVPQGFSFQGIANEALGKPASDKDIKVEIKLLQGSGTGTILYKEVHQAHTNSNGLYSLGIGMGVPTFKLFSEVEWKNSPIFISVSLDINNGNNFILAGVTQLLSVPYALFAEKSNISNCHSHFIISGNVSEQEVAQKIKNQLGQCTEFIWILNTSKITSLDLRGIDHLIELRIENNSALKEVLLPDLKDIDLDISILANPLLNSLNFSNLTSVHGSFTMTNCGIQALDLPLLEKIYNNLIVNENDQLASFTVPKLLEAGSIFLLSNRMIEEFNFPELIQVFNEFQISTNNLLSSCLLNRLKEVGKLIVHHNDTLNRLSLTQIDQVSVELVVDGCNSLSVLEFASITKAKRISIFENNSLRDVLFPMLNDCNVFLLNDNPALERSIIPALISLGTFGVTRNNNLSSMGGTNLEHIDYLDIEFNQRLQFINLYKLTTVGYITINSNISLTNVNFDALVESNGEMHFTNCDLITTFSLPIANKLGRVDVFNNKKLLQINFPQLSEVADFSVSNNLDLVAVDLDNLSSITGPGDGEGLFCGGHRYLTNIKLKNLKFIKSGILNLAGNSLSSNQVNSILNTMNAITPSISNYNLYLSDQNPPAPPDGKGLKDKISLINNGNNVITD